MKNDSTSFKNILSDIPSTPSSIKNTYAQLITLLESDEIFGALLKIKDIYELVLKYPLVITLSYIKDAISVDNDNGFDSQYQTLHQKLQEFLSDVLKYKLSMGSWETISKHISRVPFSELFPNLNESSPIYYIYRINEINSKKFYRLPGTVNRVSSWRNDTIGHGALSCNKSDVRNDVLEKLSILNGILVEHEKLYSAIKFTTKPSSNELILSSKNDDNTITITPFIEFNTGFDINASIFESYDKKNKKAKIIDYFTGDKINSPILSNVLSSIDDEIKNSSTISSILSSTDYSIYNKTILKVHTDILESIKSTSFYNGQCFSKWFIDCIENTDGGIFYCCAERGMGKSSFCRVVDQLNNSKINDNTDLSNFLESHKFDYLIRTWVFDHYFNSRIHVFTENLTKSFSKERVWLDESNSKIDDFTSFSEEISSSRDALKSNLMDSSKALDAANAFSSYLTTVFEIWSDYKDTEKLILLLDGIDEIPPTEGSVDIISLLPPRFKILYKNIYVFVFSRTPAELKDNPELRNYLSQLPQNRTLSFTRDNNLVYRKSFTDRLQKVLEINDNNSANVLANMLDWRYSYLSAITKVYPMMSEKEIKTFISNPFLAYFSYLDNISPTYSKKVKLLLYIFAISDIPLAIEDISYILNDDSEPDFALLGMLTDIRDFLHIEHTPNRGQLFSLSQAEWRKILRTMIEDDDSLTMLVSQRLPEIISGSWIRLDTFMYSIEKNFLNLFTESDECEQKIYSQLGKYWIIAYATELSKEVVSDNYEYLYDILDWFPTNAFLDLQILIFKICGNLIDYLSSPKCNNLSDDERYSKLTTIFKKRSEIYNNLKNPFASIQDRLSMISYLEEKIANKNSYEIYPYFKEICEAYSEIGAMYVSLSNYTAAETSFTYIIDNISLLKTYHTDYKHHYDISDNEFLPNDVHFNLILSALKGRADCYMEQHKSQEALSDLIKAYDYIRNIVYEYDHDSMLLIGIGLTLQYFLICQRLCLYYKNLEKYDEAFFYNESAVSAVENIKTSVQAILKIDIFQDKIIKPFFQAYYQAYFFKGDLHRIRHEFLKSINAYDMLMAAAIEQYGSLDNVNLKEKLSYIIPSLINSAKCGFKYGHLDICEENYIKAKIQIMQCHTTIQNCDTPLDIIKNAIDAYKSFIKLGYDYNLAEMAELHQIRERCLELQDIYNTTAISQGEAEINNLDFSFMSNLQN